MSVNITMPALSPTMEAGNLVKWLIKEGDEVHAGDIIAEIETDKALMEVEAVDEGIVGKIIVGEGTENVAVNSVLAILVSEGEEVPDVKEISPPAPATEIASPPVPPAPATPTTPPPVASAPPAVEKGGRVFATPIARKLASEKQIELNQIKGTGPNGRIIKADIKNHKIVPQQIQQPAPAIIDDENITRLPHDGMRKVMAERLTFSSQTIPVYYVSMECNLDALLILREKINKASPIIEGKPEYKISVNDFLVKALAAALQAVPKANVTWEETARAFHKHSDIGVAVAVDDGLYTPVVQKAETLTLGKISEQIKELAGKAKSKKLAPHEYQGGTSAISNLGMFGVANFTSIINPPHASIVSIGAGEKKAVVVNDEIKIASMLTATFAFDHRAIDGALGAELASKFKHFVEDPAMMLL